LQQTDTIDIIRIAVPPSHSITRTV